MARRRKSSKAGWNWKRIAYVGLLLTSGSGGAGGYLFKDHPALANLLHAVLGTVAGEGDPADADLAGKLKQVLDRGRAFQSAGRFSVAVDAVELGPIDGSRAPRVAISVRSIDASGHDTELWASEEVAATRDEASGVWVAHPDQDPFEVNWAPGQKIAVSVTARAGSRGSTKLYMVGATAPGFPLRPGAYGLRDGDRPNVAADPTTPGRRIVFKTTRIPDGPAPAPTRTARVPGEDDGGDIVIR